MGKFKFKNVDEPMEVFALANEGLLVPKREELSGKLKEVQKRSSAKMDHHIICPGRTGSCRIFISGKLKNKNGLKEKTGPLSYYHLIIIQTVRKRQVYRWDHRRDHYPTG